MRASGGCSSSGRGSGKSTLARALCALDPKLPSYHADVSRLSETGFVGENVENLLGALLARASTRELAHRGLLFLDGLHHIVTQPGERGSRDVSGREVQRDLVRLLDGLEAQLFPWGKHPQEASEPFPCDRLFIAAAATFEVRATHEVALRDELATLGLVEELVSRFDVIVPMRRLDAADLKAVLARLWEPARALVETTGASAVIADSGATALAGVAAASSDGAWALRPPLSRLVERALLEPPRAWTLDAALAEDLATVRPRA